MYNIWLYVTVCDQLQDVCSKIKINLPIMETWGFRSIMLFKEQMSQTCQSCFVLQTYAALF